MKLVTGSLALVALLGSSGCSKRPVAGLSGDRLAALKDLRSGIDEVQDLQRVGRAEAPLESSEDRGSRRKLKDSVNNAVREGRCGHVSDDGHMEINGAGCPIQMRVLKRANGSHGAHVEIEFHLNDSAAELVDVRDVTLVQDTEVSSGGTRGQVLVTGQSQKYGAFEVRTGMEVSVGTSIGGSAVNSTSANYSYTVKGATTLFFVSIDENGNISARTDKGQTLSQQDAQDLFGPGAR